MKARELAKSGASFQLAFPLIREAEACATLL